MKKTFTKVTAPVLAWVLAAPALAQTADPIDPATNFTKNDLVDTLQSLANWLLAVIGVIAVIMLLYGAFLFLTAAGDEERHGKAKNVVVYGLIGVLIAILSFAIVSFVASFIV